MTFQLELKKSIKKENPIELSEGRIWWNSDLSSLLWYNVCTCI